MRLFCNKLAFLLLLAASTATLHAEVTVTEALPIGVTPGVKTRLTIKGQGLESPLRVWTSCPTQVELVAVEPTFATIDLTIPASQNCGPFGLCVATPNGVSPMLTLLVDDLASVVESNSNHASSQAQPVAFLSAVDGVCDGSLSDFYQFHAESGQRVAIDVQAQRIGSSFDPVVRIVGPKGTELSFADDSEMGPDASFSFQAPDSGEYVLELLDSRYAAGGRYRLRIGDFPIVTHAYPLVFPSRTNSLVTFAGIDESQIPASVAMLGDSFSDRISNHSTRFPAGKSSTWIGIAASDLTQYVEGSFSRQALPVVPLGLGISGRLEKPREVDRFSIQGEQGQAVRFAALASSLGAPTMLRMQLMNDDGSKVAETAVNDSDEWSFDYTFPDSKAYSLQVEDLLHRGGPAFGYFVSIQPAANVSVQCFLMPDAKTRDRFEIEPTTGLAVVDLQLSRSGYDGPVEFELYDQSAKLRILNPVLASGNETRLFIAPSEGWTSDSIAAVRILAKRSGTPPTLVRSTALLRQRTPYVNYPHHFADGQLIVAGTTARADYFNAQPATPIVFARVFPDATLKWALQRTNPEFKDAIAFVPQSLPEKWAQEIKIEGDQLSIKIVRGDSPTEIENVHLIAYGDFQQRTKVQELIIPVSWIDPLIAKVSAFGALVPGQSQKIAIQIERAGGDPQPITIRLKNLPQGVTGPETVTIAADQSQIEAELQTAADAVVKTFDDVRVSATSTFAGREFTVDSQPFLLEIKQP